ncbi:Histone-lysine N-methyltransferase SETMAR [Anthophora quadrimaculata]
MSHWSGSHRAFAVEQYLKCGESLVRARRAFCTHFDIRRIRDRPSTQLIWSRVQRFRQHGTMVNQTPPGPSTLAATPEHMAQVRQEIMRNPRKSIRKISASTGIKKSTVHVILKNKLNFHPYKVQIVQSLKENNYALRETFSRTMLERFRTARTLGNILFTDEAHFHIDGCVNKQNMRYWSLDNPRERHQKRLHCSKPTVWCAISALGIIGPYFFNQRETVTAEVYCRMIDEFMLPQLQLLPGYNNRTLFQQDGATPHTARVSMEKLRAIFPKKLISKYGDIPWPPRSPDLTPCDFFLWGYLKSKVYSNSPRTIQALQENIRREVAAIEPTLCSRVFANLRARLQDCIQRNGRHLDDIIFKK